MVGIFPHDAEAPPGCAIRHAVSKNEIVDQKRIVVVSGDAHTVPAVGVDSVVDEVMWPASRITKGDTVAAVVINQIVADDEVGIFSLNGDAAVARRAAVAAEAVTFEVNRSIAVVAAQEFDRLSSGVSDRQPADRNELRLLDKNSASLSALFFDAT